MIDWNVALQTASRLSRPGPDLSAAEVDDVVAELREAAAVSEAPVREFTDLESKAHAPVLVVDRRRWVEANLATFRIMLEPVIDRLASENKLPTGAARSVGSKLTGAEVGALMSFMSGKVLGQFDPFTDAPSAPDGRLLLVAPNIVQAERQLDVDPHDFRLWVCLHEETHRVQFTAVPWLRDHLRELIAEFAESTELDSAALTRFVSDGAAELIRILRGESESSLADLFQNEQQREIVGRITGIMSLLEGHADVVMDGVGPEVIPSVAEIREKFERRRKGAGAVDRVLRRLLGLEAKMRQYRDGAVFVREVNDKVGRDGFNAVWAEPANLPTQTDILDPAAWVARVHG
ncbi:zinc-dependent metalloprotease [Aeromicrobium terrae]|uniref:Coenzyme F420 biosynthesis-associated protein n=1 Tax=Aeromicrobium terrae TaxID=2498846 RepID=A0A5C8NGM9_9ACTN|nr:zinc-dependent metalloprotease [Aeromicrobium terrae]TXL57909.1 coenzyme F420 biosynthesis-associated protein [Aeromicrobium terrae]